MAHAVTHTTAAQNAMADAVVGAAGQLGANAKVILYSGTPPANAQAALSGNVAIATITGVGFGASSGGVATITGSTGDPSAVGGVATFFRLVTSGGTPVVQGLVGTSGSDGNINNTTINAGAAVTLAGAGTYTAAA